MFDRIDRGIFWDRALRLVSGCDKVSEGCTNCWAEKESFMRSRHPNPLISCREQGMTTDRRFNGAVRIHADLLQRAFARATPTVYCIWNDLFHEAVPRELVSALMAVAKARPNHIFIICTKRPENIERKLAENLAYPVKNVWFMITAENQQRANQRIRTALSALKYHPRYRNTGFWPIVGLLAEPLLGPIDLWETMFGVPSTHSNQVPGINCLSYIDGYGPGSGIDWIITGGENGPNSRQCDPGWITSLRHQAFESGIPFFCKGIGENPDNASLDPAILPIKELPDYRPALIPLARAS